MTPTQALGCDLYRTWKNEELGALFDLFESGMDIDLLASEYSAPIKEIWHQLIHLYFAECVTTADKLAPKHGQYWSPAEDAELDRLYARGKKPNEMADLLGRTKHSVCLRLVLDRRAVMPPERIRELGLDPDDF